MVIGALITSVGCGGTAARDAEVLPGRTRPLLEHNWSHPRDLRFSENRFATADPAAALITTSSGLRAYVITDAKEPVVQITAAIPLGRGVEEPDEMGAADLLLRLLSQQIDARLGSQFLGRVQADQDVDLTRITLQVLAEDWQPALSALVETLRQPRLETAAIDAYRTGPGFARQTRGLGGPTFRPAVELSRMLAAYPLAPPDPGLSVRREAVREIASRSLRPQTIVLGIGGGIAKDEAQRALDPLAAAWHTPNAPANTPPIVATVETTADRFRTVSEPGYTTWIAVGHPTVPIAAADEAAVAVMIDILNIRLNITIREIRGLANATQLQISASRRHDGLLHVRSGARPESVAPIVRLSLQELTHIREVDGAPTVDELEQVKGGLVLGKWQGSLDGARQTSATYASETARLGSLDRLMNWPAAVRAVTAEDVTVAARKYVHPERAGAVLIGQIEEVRRARHPRWPVALDDVATALTR
ncbi:MAG: M16 family metallopeptidase [Vicinamibacterales bacterium]